MIAELYGLPGSGKTTKAKDLAAEYSLVEVSGRWVLVGLGLRFAARHPLSWLWWHFVWVWYGCWRLMYYRYFLMLRAMSMVARAEREAGRGGNVLIDEGLVQRILTIAERPVSVNVLRMWLRFCPPFGQILVMGGGDFYRYERAPDRFKNPRVALGQEYLDRWKEVVTLNHERLLSLLVSLRPATLY